MVLVVVGILLGVGFTVLADFIDNFDDETATVVNETLSPTDAGGDVVSLATADCFNTFAVTAAYNKTNGALVLTGNYTYDADSGRVTNLTADVPYDWNVTYTYQYGDAGCGGVETTVTGLETVPTWLTVLVLVVLVGIVLVLVFAVLPRFGGEGVSRFGRGGSAVAEV